MCVHLLDMHKQFDDFHDSVEAATSRWGHAKSLVETKLGQTLPLSLVIPVTLDCFADGFLIGVSATLSSTAGIVLAFANSMEMAFLGLVSAHATEIHIPH